MLHCAAACPWCCCRAARVMSLLPCCTSHIAAIVLHKSRPRCHAARVASPPSCCTSRVPATVLHESHHRHCAARVMLPPLCCTSHITAIAQPPIALRPVVPRCTAARCVIVAGVCHVAAIGCVAAVAVPPVAPPSCLLPITPPLGE